MRRPIWNALLTLILTFAATQVRADLRFDRPSVNLGDVWTGRPLAHRFGFVNTGPETIEITDLEASCGCLTPRVPQRAFRAGERGEIILEVNTLSHDQGPQSWSLHVHYRLASRQRTMEVKVSALVRAEILVQPAALTIFTSGSANHEISLTDLRTRPLAITGIRSSAPQLTARGIEGSHDIRGHLKIRVEIADNFPEGRHEEFLVIGTDDPAYPELKIMVTVNKTKRQRVIALPDRVVWQADGLTALPAQLVRLRDQNDEPVEVERAVADHPAVNCRWAKGPGPMATLKITVDRKRIQGGELQSAVHVHICKPITVVVTIAVCARSP
jgi:hypothetical protein